MEKLFPDRLSNRIGLLKIVSRSRHLGHHKGTHRSTKTGTSLDFSDFREYHPGDDLRHIDWNVYARTDKPFIKQFLDEQEMRIHLLLDSTKSMGYEEKWAFARQLAIGIGQIGLKSGDTVSFSAKSQGQDVFFRRKGALQRAAIKKLITQIEQPTLSGDFTDYALRHIPKAVTVLFIITDGLEPLEKWEHLFRRLPGFSRDIRIITVHDSSEETPRLQGDIRLVDIETEQAVEVTMTTKSIQHYKDRKLEHELKFMSLAKKYGIHVIRTEVADGILDTIAKKMRQSGWLR
ncbi:DUF58 domain-containing protein [Sporosarcina sp. Te-1]|uniref:DUF58 domain-containing protein n=1 Tax=Sporosarcina sp. Te-1 TaxID=2818390 RepID=UPI001A9F6A6A|nr:DUF58 domain-containing protein [Sporosarcina sp. Te-1]QTD42476.1 DUF58 domain-containing protein [Sporosarcina sp. Te-1]